MQRKKASRMKKHKIPISVCLWGLDGMERKRVFMNTLHSLRKKYIRKAEFSLDS